MNNDAYDVIVVGSGAAGLSAACTAAALGKRVVVLEASDKLGGTTAISGGMVWIPANQKMDAAGITDSLEAARSYLGQTVGAAAGDARMEAFLRRGDEAIRFLEERTSLRLRPVRRYPDYYPEMPGATAGGRVLEPVPFDGARLGSEFPKLRDPLPEFMLLGGMMVSREDLPVLRRVGRSPRALWYASRLVARYALQRLRFHRGTTLVLGNALVARLLRSALDLKVEILLESPVVGLVIQEDAVVGVRVRHLGQARHLRAAGGVILATGGISHHPDLRRPYVPAAAGNATATFGPSGAQPGARLALSVGACMSEPVARLEDALAFWVPASRFVRANGTAAVFPHTVTDRAKPGLIAVNKQGRRFVNEAVSYHEFVRAQLRDADGNVPAWLVCDSKFLWKYGLGRVRPFTLSVETEVRSGYLRRAVSLQDLARQLEVAQERFVHTVATFNSGAALGKDPEFGRGSNIYQRHLGDPDHDPNPCVAPIERPPYYAVAVYPADLGMAAGISTDEHTRVLDAGGRPIQGLYACGNDMHSVMNGAYPGPGITLGPALVFGFIAGRHACERSPAPSFEMGFDG